MVTQDFSIPEDHLVLIASPTKRGDSKFLSPYILGIVVCSQEV